MTEGGGRRVLVAGIGNIFLGDDGFGVAVVNRLDAATLPSGVDVADYGIRGVHLAYELLGGRYRTLIMVDAAPVGGPPGTLAVVEPAAGESGGGPHPPDASYPAEPPVIDGHGMTPDAVLSVLRGLGGNVERVLVVACQPAVIEERMGLSDAVTAAIDDAVDLVTTLCRAEARNSGTAGREQASA
jgi:hydrogenase maturation protease